MSIKRRVLDRWSSGSSHHQEVVTSSHEDSCDDEGGLGVSLPGIRLETASERSDNQDISWYWVAQGLFWGFILLLMAMCDAGSPDQPSIQMRTNKPGIENRDQAQRYAERRPPRSVAPRTSPRVAAPSPIGRIAGFSHSGFIRVSIERGQHTLNPGDTVYFSAGGNSQHRLSGVVEIIAGDEMSVAPRGQLFRFSKGMAVYKQHPNT